MHIVAELLIECFGLFSPFELSLPRDERGTTCTFRASDERRAGLSLGRRAVPGKVKLLAGRVLHIDHLFARMQRLNIYEAKTNAMTRIGSNLSQVVPPPFNCE